MRGWLRQAAGGLPRQFWYLWTGSLINRLGSFVILFLALYLTADRGLSQTRAGLVIGAFGVGGAAGNLLGGILADRWGRRPTMLAAQFSAAAVMLALGLADTYPQILAAAFLLGFCTDGVRPAFQAMMVDLVPAHDRIRAFSLNYWAINLGFAGAAILAGLAAQADYFLLFAVDAASTLGTALITLFLVAETNPARRTAAAPPDRGGLRTVLTDRVFMTFVLLNLLSVVVIMQHLSTLPITMNRQGLSPATFGWVMAVNGFLIVLGQLFIPRLIGTHRPSHVLALAYLIVGTGFGLVALAGDAWLFALTVAIWTVGEMLQSPSNATLIAALAPVPLRGRYQGINSLSWSAGAAAAPILGGLVQEHTPPATLWLACLVVCAAGAAGHLLAAPSRERRIRAVAAAEAPTTPAAGPAVSAAPPDALAADAHETTEAARADHADGRPPMALPPQDSAPR